jgi:hypothetical protein
LYIGLEAGFIDSRQAKAMIQEAIEISRMLQGLIRRCTEPTDSAPPI